MDIINSEISKTFDSHWLLLSLLGKKKLSAVFWNLGIYSTKIYSVSDI